MADTPPTKVVNLRLPADLHVRLKAYADRTERSINGAAVFAIRSYLDQLDAGSPPLHIR